MTFRRALTLIGTALAVLAVGVGPAAAFTTTTNQGATGLWLGSDMKFNTCLGSLHRIDTEDAYVGRTSRYASNYQTIYMQPRLDITGDGYHWQPYVFGGTGSSTVPPGQMVHFRPPTFSGLPQGYGYRVVMRFWWYVGSTNVGYVEDVFNQPGDYINGGAQGYVFNGAGGAGCEM